MGKGEIVNSEGYVRIYKPKHLRACQGYVLRSILVAEKSLEKELPKHIIMHHVDGNTGRDTSDNLVICEDFHYHRLIHRRQRAFRACGNARWRKCFYCKKYDDPKKMHPAKGGLTYYHQLCKSNYDKKRHPEVYRKYSVKYRRRHWPKSMEDQNRI